MQRCDDTASETREAGCWHGVCGTSWPCVSDDAKNKPIAHLSPVRLDSDTRLRDGAPLLVLPLSLSNTDWKPRSVPPFQNSFVCDILTSNIYYVAAPGPSVRLLRSYLCLSDRLQNGECELRRLASTCKRGPCIPDVVGGLPPRRHGITLGCSRRQMV